MAQAAEEARAKYKQQKNGDIFSNEVQAADTADVVDVYEHYTHHKGPFSNIIYSSNESDVSSGSMTSETSRDSMSASGESNDIKENASPELDKSIDLEKADEEDLQLDSQKVEDEEKLKEDYEKKLEELKSEYIDKMREIEDKFDEKHKDLQDKRIEIERQYQEQQAQYYEEHLPRPDPLDVHAHQWETAYQPTHTVYEDMPSHTPIPEEYYPEMPVTHDYQEYGQHDIHPAHTHAHAHAHATHTPQT